MTARPQKIDPLDYAKTNARVDQAGAISIANWKSARNDSIQTPNVGVDAAARIAGHRAESENHFGLAGTFNQASPDESIPIHRERSRRLRPTNLLCSVFCRMAFHQNVCLSALSLEKTQSPVQAGRPI